MSASRIAVIGGGIAGVSAAAELAPFAAVTLFEAEDHLATHASGRSAAMFEENYGNAVVQALNRASYQTLADAGVLSPRGLMLIARNGEDSAFEADCSTLGMREVPLGAARSRIPILADCITRAAVHEEAQDIDTHGLIQYFVRIARGNGADIRLATKVTEVSPGWRVNGEPFDMVVNAAGAWADQVAQMAGVDQIGLQPFRRSVARLPAPGGHDVRSWPMVFGVGETWYAKPDAGAWIVSPAEEDPMDPFDAWADDMVIAEGLARYEAHVTEPVARVENTWAGLRTFAPDRALVIGEGAPGFFWCAGQGGYGFQTSAAAARLLRELVLGQTPSLDSAIVAAVSPERFRLVNS